MDHIKFYNGDFTIKYRSEEIPLLPKEFYLLSFLYQSPSRIFTREELLDAVWSMEAPTDRTVDDHIYRLRKKLHPLSSIIRIETVRGQGYRLIQKNEVGESPLLQDKDVTSNVKMLFHKYHLYGQGDALKLLEENQAVFGFELDVQSRLYLHFMKGDFHWFLEREDIPFWEKCYYYLHIYSYISADKEKCLEYFTKAMNGKELPSFHRLEIRLLNRLSLLLYTKDLDQAETILTQAKEEITEKELEGLIPFLSLTELYLVFLRGDKIKIEEKMEEVQDMLVTYPFSRERATFTIMKGIKHLALDNESEAEHYFNQGFGQFQEAKYIPGILISLNAILFFLEEFEIKGELHNIYQNVWDKFAKEYNFADLEQRIGNQLDFHLR